MTIVYHLQVIGKIEQPTKKKASRLRQYKNEYQTNLYSFVQLLTKM